MSNWITVCEFPLSKDLSAVADFIRRHQLPLRITEENNQQCVASLAPQLVDPMKQLLQRWHAGEVDLSQVQVHTYDENAPVSQSPDPERDPAAGEQASEKPSGAEADESAQAVVPPSVIPQWSLRQTPLSLVLIALCFIGWLMLRQGWYEPLIIYPQKPGAFDASQSTLALHLAVGEFWRLWTPAMVHFSLPHALFNSLGIWIVGRSLEARAGTWWFALLVLIAAPVSNLVQYYWAPQNLFGGMSGVVYALFGAAFVIQRWQPRWRDVPPSLVWLAVVWLVVCMLGVVDYFIPGGIANAAHIGGFAAGLLLALLFCAGGGARRYFSAGSAHTADASPVSGREF